MIYLGIDLGGTTIAAGLTDINGNILETASVPTARKRGQEAIIQDIIKVSRQLIQSFKIDKVGGMGIGVPGPVDVKTGNIKACVNLGWSNVPIVDLLEKELHIPAFVGNDANLAGIAEMEAGALKGAESGIIFTLGTGVGGGIFVHNKIIHGSRPVGTEIGHMIVGENFYDCNCGNNGCLETFCSATAIISYAKRLLEQGGTSPMLMEMTGNRTDNINGVFIFNAAKNGDPLCTKVIDRLAHYLAIGIMNMSTATDPDIVAIGGGLSKAGDFLLNKVRKEYVSLTKYFTGIPPENIKFAELGNDAGIVGAAMLAKQGIMEGNK